MNQSKNQQFMICYSSLQFFMVFKMSINNPLKWKIYIVLQQAQFFLVWSPFYVQAKNYDLPPSFSIIFGSRLSYKKSKVSEAQSNRFNF